MGRAFGCARVVFNDGLRARQEAHEAGRPYVTDAELSARLTGAKQTPERQWLGGVSAVVLQQALADLNAAYPVGTAIEPAAPAFLSYRPASYRRPFDLALGGR